MKRGDQRKEPTTGRDRAGEPRDLGIEPRELRQHGDRWRVTFYPAGLAHSIVYGTAEEAWRAVQRAAWSALNDLRAAP